MTFYNVSNSTVEKPSVDLNRQSSCFPSLGVDPPSASNSLGLMLSASPLHANSPAPIDPKISTNPATKAEAVDRTIDLESITEALWREALSERKPLTTKGQKVVPTSAGEGSKDTFAEMRSKLQEAALGAAWTKESTLEVQRFELQTGFGNEFSSEAVCGAIPKDINSPRVHLLGLYTEQISGNAFTAERQSQRRTWMYRIHPTVSQGAFHPLRMCGVPDIDATFLSYENYRQNVVSDFSNCEATAEQILWHPLPLPSSISPSSSSSSSPPISASFSPASSSSALEIRHGYLTTALNWFQSLATLCGSGSALNKTGFAIHSYGCTASMTRQAVRNVDGDYLILPQSGPTLRIQTELGLLDVGPGQLAVIPRGLLFRIEIGPRRDPGTFMVNESAKNGCKSNTSGSKDAEVFARGFVFELFEGASQFKLPNLGVLGANGLAYPRHFKSPVAFFEYRASDLSFSSSSSPTASSSSTSSSQTSTPFMILHKLGGRLFLARCPHSPFDVVGWYGNHVPFMYDISNFCPVNNVRFDHADPSVFTILTAPSVTPGVAIVDVVAFPPRWSVSEKTFRPPYFHRNTASEFVAYLKGKYEAKKKISAGSATLHVCMSPHGPDAETCKAEATREDETPKKLPDDSMTVMFETWAIPRLAGGPVERACRDGEYVNCWKGIPELFPKASNSF